MTPAALMDVTVGLLCLFIAMCMAALHWLGSPKRKHWQSVPDWVRWPLWPCCAAFVVRGINLLALSTITDPTVRGHANVEGLMTALMLSWVFGGMVVHTVLMTYPERFWERMTWLQERARCKRPAVIGRRETPALITPDDAALLLASRGAVVYPPSYEPGALDDATSGE